MELERPQRGRGPARRGRFPVALAAVLFGLSLLYALLFSHMVHVSLVEQVFAVHWHPPRYAGPPHFHNAAEWVLLVVPALVSWTSAVGTGSYLARRLIGR